MYDKYLRELRISVARSLRSSVPNPQNVECFEIFTPLWTLIYGLQNEENTPNPTKQLLMSHLRESGDLSGFLSVCRDRSIENSYGPQLRAAHSAMTFNSYFDELVSDSLQFINAFHFYNYRSCMISVRCILENLYRHLYYLDNREYFIRVHELGESEHDLKLTPALFRTYLEGASYLKSVNSLKWSYVISGKNFTGLQKLNQGLYSKTSSYVHGSLPSTLNRLESNLDLVYDPSKADEVIKMAEMLIEMCVAFLCCAHLGQFSGFNETEKRLVLAPFKGTKRPNFRNAIRV